MPTLVATPGAANANSYIDAADADAYFDERLHSTTWTAATTDDKERALIMATRTIDARLCFEGVSETDTQALKFPRSGLLGRTGYAVPSGVVPEPIREATCELALLLLGSDVTQESDQSVEGIRRVKAGPVDITFKDSIELKDVPESVLRMIPEDWLCDTVSSPTFTFKAV